MVAARRPPSRAAGGVGEHGGVEVDTEGDAFFVAFASAARRGGGGARRARALASHAWPHGRPVRVRMGVHSGEPQVRDGTYWGIDVHYAARLCSAAHGGQVLLSSATRALVADADVDDLGEHALKDFPSAAERVSSRRRWAARGSRFRRRGRSTTARTNLPSLATPLVGRELELADLVRRLTESRERLVTLTGSGGSGKTQAGDRVRHASCSTGSPTACSWSRWRRSRTRAVLRRRWPTRSVPVVVGRRTRPPCSSTCKGGRCCS